MPTTLDKPAGLPVFPPHADAAGDCLLHRLLADQPWRRDVAWPRGFEGGIAHRLDNSTSGAVLAADSLEELAQLRAWFAQHKLTKTYLMLAACDVPWRTHTCSAAIAHHPRKKSLMVVQRSRTTAHRGKWYPASTTFRRLRSRLVEVAMTGGIMHQIRVHAAHLGVPILGDKLYGGGATPADAPPGLTFFLHHVGMKGPDGLVSGKVEQPCWADDK